MFRRRAMRMRPIPPAGGPRRAGPRRALEQANRLMENGEYAAAAPVFEQLGRGAQQRGLVKQAAFLLLQAAQNYLLADQARRGIGLMNEGLGLLAEAQRWPALRQAGELSLAELQRLELHQEAAGLQAWLEKTLPARQAGAPEPAAQAQAAAQPPRLPLKCPFCGAALRADLLEWIDAQTAECLYCASPVRAEAG
jgi:hypothetical protein